MKLLSYLTPDGYKSYGILQGEGVIDLPATPFRIAEGRY
jgi:hypothetical protein